MALRVDTALAIPGLLVVPLGVAAIVFAARPARRLQRDLFAAESSLVSDTAEAIDGAAVLRAYEAVEPMWEKIDQGAARSEGRGIAAETWTSAAGPLVELAGALGIAVVFALAWSSRGSVDLAATTEPWITRIGRSGAGTPVFGGSELYEDFQYSYFMMSPRLVSEDPDLGARVMQAVSDGIAQYNQGKTDRNIEIISKYTKLDADFLKEACWADIPENAAFDADAVGALQDWYREQGFIEEPLPADAYFQRF